MNAQIQTVCDKMASVAGFISSDIDWTDSAHLSMEWTKEQEDEFRIWLSNELKTNKPLRLVMMNIPSNTSKKYLDKAANEFTWQFGFKTK
jgi:hypothetical protein